MHEMMKLRDMMEHELKEYSDKPKMSAGDLEVVHKLTDTIKNIDKICMMDETGEYSQAGDMEMMRRYDRGNSYAMRGRYSRDDGYSMAARKRDSMGRYSRDGDEMMARLEDMMHDSGSESERRTIRKMIDELRRA